MAEEARSHTLQLRERKQLTMTGVSEVVSFEETAVVLQTSLGLLIVQGSGLQLKNLTLDGGQVAITGTIGALNYQEPRKSFWGRLLG